MRRTSCGLVTIILAIATAVIAPERADAVTYDNMYLTGNTDWDCTDGGTLDVGDLYCQTDNSALTWFAEASIGTTGYTNIYSMIYNEYDATDLNVSYQDPPVTTGSGQTDIIYKQGDLEDIDPGALAITWCNDAATLRQCDQHYVRFDLPNPAEKVASHETGHAVGLTHGHESSGGGQPGGRVLDSADSLGVMQTPVNEIDGPGLGDHNIAEINSIY